MSLVRWADCLLIPLQDSTMDRSPISLRALIATVIATVMAAGVLAGIVAIPFVGAALRVGWFAAPLELLGLDRFGLVAVAFGWAAVPASVWLLIHCRRQKRGGLITGLYFASLILSTVLFIAVANVSSTKRLVLLNLVMLTLCIGHQIAGQERGWILCISAATLLFLAFWFVTSGL
ncbi:MAG: hypothetical protein EA381_08490, partial [Planctomycetaceae bacterium]